MKTFRKITVILILALLLCGCSPKTIKGKVETTSGVKDEVFNISADSQILVRYVEMCQYSKDENSNVNLVLANYPIESFDNYVNPEFPDDIKTKIIHNPIVINGTELNEEQIETLVYTNFDSLVDYNNLEIEYFPQYNLVLKENAYVSCGKDWQLGDIRVSYKVLNFDPLIDYEVDIVK